MKWGLDFAKPIKLVKRYTRNNYTTKWIKAKALCTNIKIVMAKFIYEFIITKFGCPLILVNDQSTHFINNAIDIFAPFFVMTYDFDHLLPAR
jgi:hypothetical protein